MLTTLLLTAAAALASPAIEGEFIFPPNEKHNHGSSIAETAKGDLIACWFHGSGERTADDVMVQGARRKAGETTWSEPFLMADTPNLPDCNPVLFIDPKGKLWLFWVAIQANEWGSALLMSRTSTDYDGAGAPVWNWQAPIHTEPKNLIDPFKAVLKNAEDTLGPFLAVSEGLRKDLETGKQAIDNKLTRRLGWMTRTRPVALASGRIMLGLYSDVFNCSLAAYTDDDGQTWQCSEPILDPRANMLGNVQPGFIQRANGEVVCYMRDNGIPHYVRTSVSKDNGETWSGVELTKIRDAGASVASLGLKSGNWIMLNNDQADGRHRLTAHLSDDEGATWKWNRPLENEEKGGGGFSYPCMIQGSDGRIHATYSYNKKGIEGETIKHVAFDEAWVMEEGKQE